MISQIKPLKKGLIIVPSYFPTSYLLAVPPSLCSPFLVSSLPSNRQHPIPLHSLLTKRLFDRLKPHDHLTSQPLHWPSPLIVFEFRRILFHFLALLMRGELREGLTYHSFPKYRHCLDGRGPDWIIIYKVL